MTQPLEIRRSLEVRSEDSGRPPEAVHFCVRSVRRTGRRPRAFTEKDLFLVVLQAVLGSAIRLLPPCAWRRVCAVTSSLRVLSRRRKELPPFAARVGDVLGPQAEGAASQLFATVQRRLHERQATCFREDASWQPPVTEVEGIGHLQASLAAGRGAILWNTPALGDTIVTKRALANAGHPVHQFSVRSHGFSQTPFAVRHVNPRQIAVEDRFLAGRIYFDGDDTLRALREVTRRLNRNAAVMFTNSTFSGRSFVLVPFGRRFFLPLASAPMNLAAKLDVPLHLVTTVETDSFRHYRTTISPDMRPEQAAGEGRDGDETVARIAVRVRDRLRLALLEEPDQIRLWDPLVPLPPDTHDPMPPEPN